MPINIGVEYLILALIIWKKYKNKNTNLAETILPTIR